MKIYLASAFVHRSTLLEWAHEMEGYSGIEVCSSWVYGSDGEDALTPEAWRSLAIQDERDLRAADVLVCYCPGDSKGRGGRHTEFGMAVALKKRLVIIGQREQVFHYLDGIKFVGNHHEAIAFLLDVQLREPQGMVAESRKR